MPRNRHEFRNKVLVEIQRAWQSGYSLGVKHGTEVRTLQHGQEAAHKREIDDAREEAARRIWVKKA